MSITIRLAIRKQFGVCEPTLFAHPRLYSPAVLPWIQFPQERSWDKFAEPQRTAFFREIFELEQLFPVTAASRNRGALQ